ncbi:MAG: ribonuclease HII [Acidobacteriota bacterium]
MDATRSDFLHFERALWESGVSRVAGVDEAGVGPLAGPVVAAAVILPPGVWLDGVDDSKRLSAGQRAKAAERIRREALAYAVAQATPEEIDRLNIAGASVLAMERAVSLLAPPPEHVLVDYRRLLGLACPQTSVVKGDQRSLSIAAASILAKTARDEIMTQLDRQFPGYGFARHKGYPTAEHYAALGRLGPSRVHRRSFRLTRERPERQPTLFSDRQEAAYELE